MRVKAGIVKHKVWGAVGVLGALIAAAPALANPEGGVVAAGSAVIHHADKLTTVRQATDKAVIDWRRFDIAPDETTRFEQPSVSSMTLNRVNDIKPSSIQGKLIANGGVVLVNPNGVVFGKNSVIDAASILATTADIHNKNFMQGNMVFNKPGNPDAKIINEGLITAKEAGLVGFVAPSVLNSGIITAKVGKVKLASGDSLTIDLMGDGLLKIEASGKLKQQLVANYGSIQANGGTIQMTAAAARHAIDSLILNEGQLSAQTVSQDKQGNITIRNDSGDVINSGIIDTSGRKEKQRGGDITITGKNVALMDGTLIDASGHTGKSNTTNDKTLTQKREGAAGGDIKIGGDYLGKGDTPTAQNLYVSPNSDIFNDALDIGDAGRTIFWSDNVTSFYGNVFARANVGDGGFVETSGYKFLDAQGNVDLTTNNGQRGTYFLDPTDIAIYGSVTPAFSSTDGTSISLSSSLKLWLDASDTSNVNLTYNSLGTTATGTSGQNTITVSANTDITVGSRIRLGSAGSVTAASTVGADTYTVSNIAGTTITLSSNLTQNYSGSTIFQGYVSQLTDKSASGFSVTQSTANKMPLWISNAQNGLGVTSFNGGSQILNATPGSLPDFTSYTMLNTQKNTGVLSADAIQFYIGNAGTNGFGHIVNGSTNTVLFGGNVLKNSGATTSNYEIWTSTWNGTTSIFALNNANQALTNSGVGLNTPSNDIGLGGVTHNLTAGFVGYIPEAILYNTTLTANPRNLMNQYQSAKWGIALDPNTGTALSEVVEATASTGYSVFTTRYLERLSQSANISLQATNNITLDLKGDNLNFTTANRSLTLNAGNQIINASAGTITTNNGAISLTGTTGGIVLNNALTLNSGTATTTFNSPINGANNLTATAGTFSFASPLGGTTPLSALSLTSANAFNLPSIRASSITASTTTGNIAGEGGLVTTGGNLNLTAGTDLDLSAIGIVTNNGNATLGGHDVTLNTWINTGTGNFTVNASRDIFLTRNNLTSGLVGRWEFDEGSGTTATDSSSTGNTGTLTNGPTWSTSDPYGLSGNGSLSFDTTNDYVEVPNSASLSLAQITFGAWIYPTSLPAGFTLIGSKWSYWGGNPSNEWHFAINNNKLNLYAGTASNLSGNTTLTLNQWHYVAFSVNGTNATLFLDGVVDGSGTSGSITTGTSKIAIGDIQGRNLANIDDVRIYNTALTDTQISQLYAPQVAWTTGTTSLTAGRDVAFNLGGDTLTIGSGKSISVAATGAISSSSAGTISATKSAGVGGDITMTAGSTANVSNLTLNPNSGGAASLTSVGNLNTGFITAGSILARTTGMGSDITLGGNLNGSDAGTAITLASADDFSNAGNYTLTTGGAGGRWLIYSDKPADNNLGTLTGGFNRYTCTYAAACPTFGATGNGLLYSYTPTLTITPSALSAITYYDAAPSLVGYAYGFSGYLGSDSETLTGALTGTTTYTAGSNAGTYNVNYSSGSLTSGLGYGFTYANNASAITVNKADLTLTADNKTKVSGTANPIFTGVFTGFVGGQTLGTSGIAGDAAFTTAATTGSPAGAYAIIASLGTLTSNNYNFATFTDGTLTVTAAPSGGGGGTIVTPPVIAPEPPVVVIPPLPPVITPQPPTSPRPIFTIDVVNIIEGGIRNLQSQSGFSFRNSSSSDWLFGMRSIRTEPIFQWKVVYYDPNDYPNGQPPSAPFTIYLLKDDEEADLGVEKEIQKEQQKQEQKEG